MVEPQDLLKALNVKCMETFIRLFCVFFFGLRTWKDGLAIVGKTRGCPCLGNDKGYEKL